MNGTKQNLTPDWLKDLQHKSWEPEILLSGIVLYGMFQVPRALDQFLFFFSNNVFSYINIMDLLVALFKMGVYWLIVGLILHLICRGLWIGLVGLSYSFPEGIKSDKLKYQKKYLVKINAIPPFEQIVLKLERICSIIYSVSFMLFMSLVGAYLYFLVLLIIPITTLILSVDSLRPNSDFQAFIQTYSQVLLIIGAVGLVDFLTMGYLRRFRFFAKVYWPLYQIFSYLTLAKYYRSTYYAIVTNLNRWKLFFFFLIYAFTSPFLISSMQVSNPESYFSRIEIWSRDEGDNAREGYYQDRSTENPRVLAQIPSDVIRDNVLRVFIPARISLQDSLKKFIRYDSIMDVSNESFDEGSYLLSNVARFYDLSIEDSTFRPKMYFQDNAATTQRGYITYLNIGHLQEGLYELKLSGPSSMYEDPFAVIPFYKVD